MPSFRKNISLIDFDVEESINTILKAMLEESGSRTKPLIAVTHGQGGGKARVLEELRRNLQQNHSDVLTIAIPFNSIWSPSYGDDRYFQSEAPSSIVIYMVIDRMLSVFYGMGVEDVCRLLPLNNGICAARSF